VIIPAERQEQQRFLPEADKDMTSLAQRRVYVGEFFERATQALFGAHRLQVSTAAYICPDLELEGRYLENKSIGKSGELIVRKNQLDREKEFCKEHSCYYVLWRHTAPVMTSATRADLYQMLAMQAQEVLVLSSETLHRMCAERKLIGWMQRMQPSRGKLAEKCEGYRLRWKDLSAQVAGKQEHIVWSVQSGEHWVGPVTLRIERSDDLFLRGVRRA
jgi:hypothetical protein